MFSIYNLNLYQNFYNLEYFSIITEAKEYISGRDLAFLSNCENLEIILLNDMSEIIFEDFALLKSLRKITIGADFSMELDFNLLPDYIETLTILVPKEIVPYAKSEAYEYRKFKKVIIKDLEVIE